MIVERRNGGDEWQNLSIDISETIIALDKLKAEFVAHETAMTDVSKAQPNSVTSLDRKAEPLSIEGISAPAILRYFEAMNAGDFGTVASLFAAEGVMHPPFESSIVGHEAIASYLNQEARGMLLQPRQGMAQSLDVDTLEVTVTGKVQTPLFGVNVNWIFVLNSQSEIILARIKLIASPQELLSLRR